MRIYINNLENPGKIWQIDNGQGTRSRYYQAVHLNPGVSCQLLQNLKAPEGEAKAWVHVDKAHVYVQRSETKDGVEVHILPRY
jgi:hypothetical protein